MHISLPNEPKQCRNSIFDFNLPPEEMDDFFICFYLLAVLVVCVYCLLLLFGGAFVENSVSPAIEIWFEYIHTLTLCILETHTHLHSHL